jgi:hypothetical protein
MEDMEKQVAACLDDIPLVQIQRYYFCTFFVFFLGFDRNRLYKDLPTVQHEAFIDAYRKGLDGPQAVWANRKYHGHRVLPNNIMETLVAAGKA